MTASRRSNSLSAMALVMLCLSMALSSVTAFVAPSSVSSDSLSRAAFFQPKQLNMAPSDAISFVDAAFFQESSVTTATDLASSSSMTLGATTLDPSSFFTGIFGSFLNTPLILAIPIVAALGVAGLLAFLLVKSSEPEEDE